MMTERELVDQIVDNLLFVMPVVHKKIIKANPGLITRNIRLTPIHVGILSACVNKNVTITEIGRVFLIPKPQMTHFVDKLVEAGLMDRQPNKIDRRVTDLILTPEGQTALNNCTRFLKKNVRRQLSGLTQEELEGFSQALSKIRAIATRFEKD